MPVDDAPLQDIKEIITTRPDLSPEEKVVADKLMPHLKALAKPEVRAELEGEFLQRETVKLQAITTESRAAVQKAIEEWKKEQEPLTDKEISELLNQEYNTFTVVLHLRNKTKHEFTLVELPQEIENKFVGLLQKKLIPLMKTLSAAEFKLDMDGSATDKLESILQATPDTLTICAQLVAMCLDPFGENNPKIDQQWVTRNMSTYRILAVVLAQVEVNRYRDFFLNGFRLSKSLKQTR